MWSEELTFSRFRGHWAHEAEADLRLPLAPGNHELSHHHTAQLTR